MKLRQLLFATNVIAMFLPGLLPAQEDSTGQPEGHGMVLPELPEHILQLADTLAFVNQIHGPYVGFDGETTSQYRNFIELSELACTGELLALTESDNAVVRGYAFWALARQQYVALDSILLAHAQDEELVREIQGGIINNVPLIDFMQWVVDPGMLDEESRKLKPEVFQRVSELRFSDR